MSLLNLQKEGYELAPEIDDAIQMVIEKYPDKFKFHLEAKFLGVFRYKASKRGNKFILGSAQGVSELYKTIIHCDYIIQIWRDAWFQMDDKGKEALIFHELSHCFIDKKEDKKNSGLFSYSFRLLPHDFEGFTDELEIFGNWTGNLPEHLLREQTKEKD